MSNVYRPRFYDSARRWQSVIEKLKAEGIDFAENVVFSKPKVGAKAKHEVNEESDGNVSVFTSKSYRIKSVEQLLDEVNADTENYQISKYVVNKWDGFYKNPENEAQVVEMFQVKVWLEKKVSDVKELLAKIQLGVQQEIKALSIPRKPYNNKRGSLLVEPMITDHHIGKLCFDNGQLVWDKQKAIDAYEQIIENILDDVGDKNIDSFLLPIGNDLINVDSQGNNTFNGTPQMSGELYEQIIIDTELLLMRVIARLADVANVLCVMIPGNHDRSSVFHIGRSCLHYFKNDKRVKVYDSLQNRQYVKWNDVMIGFTHGDKARIDRLPFLAATEAPEIWGTTKHREFHVGHFHHEKTAIHNSINKDGMTVRICPTVCPADRWHKDSGYVGANKASACYIFEPDRLQAVRYY